MTFAFGDPNVENNCANIYFRGAMKCYLWEWFDIEDLAELVFFSLKSDTNA